MKSFFKKTACAAIGASCILTLFHSANAQSQVYPTRPVTIIVPFAAGGATDLIARKTAQLLSSRLGQPFVVENRAGASGMIGMRAVVNANPDGYTLAWAVNSSTTVVPYLLKKPPYDPDPTKTFAPVSVAGISSWALITRPNMKVSSVAEFVAMAKANPQSLTFGSSGVGSAPHLLTEMLKLSAGIDAVHVPFKGESESINALLGGHIDFLIGSAFIANPLIQGGQVNGLAVSTPTRDKSVPALPTFQEAGFPELTFEIFYGLLAPAGTPEPIISKLADSMKLAVADPDFIQIMEKSHIRAKSATPTEFSALLKSHSDRWRTIIEREKITID